MTSTDGAGSVGGSGPLPTVEAARIDPALVRRLLVEQFPQWAGLPVRPVTAGGNDHRMFRLGRALTVRLPSAAGYVPQVHKEQAWLPRLGPQLPLPIPQVRGAGRASAVFPAPWSVYGWVDGRPPAAAEVRDDDRFAGDLATFLVALRSADTAGAPGPGLHSGYRGGPLEHWDDEMGDLLGRVSGRERDVAARVWRDALDARFDGIPGWVHGDTAISNLLVDDATWARGRGWALWKGLIMLSNRPAGQADFARHVLTELFSDE